MKRFFSGVLLALAFTARAQHPTDSLLQALTVAIGKMPDYDSAKTREIARLRAALPSATISDQIGRAHV